ncbi:GH3 auxin-responsive promoter family protein [Mesorhizobium sp. WSM1293]|uniref:GH3 family domain-containing protein n=1 Tax=Mesorhizobium sp. WSM1293 TaxID=1040984 RepID=UPI0004813C8A|nr:GH3 auxin-responsive promoter family protein [Mesorhizobium sp. WSM1293]
MGAEAWARIAGATAAGDAGFRARLGQIEADESGATLFAWQSEAGLACGPIVTTGSGLYRYDTQDKVEVIGATGDTPRLRLSERTTRGRAKA